MNRIVIGAGALVVLTLASGCAYNSIAGTGIVRADQYFGNVGVTGGGSNITILNGSKVPKLSILGNNNTITVEENVELRRIEFWGKGNTVSVPEDLTVRTTEVGNNQIIRRPRMKHEAPIEWIELEYDPDTNTLERVDDGTLESLPVAPAEDAGTEPADDGEPDWNADDEGAVG